MPSPSGAGVTSVTEEVVLSVTEAVFSLDTLLHLCYFNTAYCHRQSIRPYCAAGFSDHSPVQGKNNNMEVITMITKEKKAQIMAEYGRTPNDTGSPEVQIALLTERITELTEHLKKNPNDHHSRPNTIGRTSAIRLQRPAIGACDHRRRRIGTQRVAACRNA